MLENIKSLNITKTVFSMLSDCVKLNIIKNNKHFQSKINISLIDYKVLSGKYIVYGKNGKGKEYDKYYDRLIFEGEYINGKRNGKGKEYEYDELIFE